MRRRELVGQLERLRDLYVMGDLSKNEYVLRRQALEEELARATPPFDPRLDKAEELLADFARVWELEDDPAKRRRLLATLFDRIWQDGGTIVAVKPREAFLRYFQTADELARRREKKRGVKSGSDGTRTRDLRRDRCAQTVSAGFAAIAKTSLSSGASASRCRAATQFTPSSPNRDRPVVRGPAIGLESPGVVSTSACMSGRKGEPLGEWAGLAAARRPAIVVG
jgi:hypothetical protein